MPSSAFGMLGGMFDSPQSNQQQTSWNAPQGYLSNPDRKGSMMLEWLFGDPAAAERYGIPPEVWSWSNFQSGGPGYKPPGSGNGGGGTTSPPPPPAPEQPWNYPDLYETPYVTTNWFGKT